MGSAGTKAKLSLNIRNEILIEIFDPGWVVNLRAVVTWTRFDFIESRDVAWIEVALVPCKHIFGCKHYLPGQELHAYV